MSLSQQTENNVDISSMINEVNAVLHKHLTSILTPLLQEKQSIQQILLNMPMVKQLQTEHFNLQKKHFII